MCRRDDTTSRQPTAIQLRPVPTASSRRRCRYTALPGETFELTAASRIVVDADDPASTAVAERFAAWLRRADRVRRSRSGATGRAATSSSPSRPAEHGAEGYTLRADSAGVRIAAATPVGLFRALTTLRQMLPAAAEARTCSPGPWTVDRSRDRRPAALRVPRDDARRRPSLLRRRRRAPPHRPDLAVQGQRPPPPPHRRPGLAVDGARLAAAHRGRRRERHRRRRRRVLQRRRLRPHRRLRRRALHRGRAGDRRPRSCVGRPHRLSGVELRRGRSAAVPPRRHLRGVAVCTSADSTYGFLGDVFDALAVEPGRYIHIGGDEAIGTPHDDFLQFVPARRRTRRRTRTDAGDVARGGAGGAARRGASCSTGASARTRRPSSPAAPLPRAPG